MAAIVDKRAIIQKQQTLVARIDHGGTFPPKIEKSIDTLEKVIVTLDKINACPALPILRMQ